MTSKRSIHWFLESSRAWSFFTRAFAKPTKSHARLYPFVSSPVSYLFTYGPTICSSVTKRWHRTYPIDDAPLRCRDAPLSARHSFVPLRNHRSYCERKPYPVWSSCRRKSYPVTVCHSMPETPLWYCGFWCLSIRVVLRYLDRALPCCVHPNCSVFLSFPHTSVSSFVFRVVEEIFFVGERVIFDPWSSFHHPRSSILHLSSWFSRKPES